MRNWKGYFRNSYDFPTIYELIALRFRSHTPKIMKGNIYALLIVR